MTAKTVQPVETAALVRHLDELLAVESTPDYPPAMNGLQVANRSPIHRVAAAVDASRLTIEGAIAEGANLLLVHHGLFWSGSQPVTGARYDRLRLLFDNDIAVYSAHLPLDAHPTLGNNVLLAQELGLKPSGPFGAWQGIHIGVQGQANISTSDLFARANEFSGRHGGRAIATAFEPGRLTRRWALVTGGGASSDTLREARESRVDTLIVGEGPHWTAVDAPEQDLVIIYAGHYATETLGVRAVARHVEKEFGIPWSWIPAPTGL